MTSTPPFIPTIQYTTVYSKNQEEIKLFFIFLSVLSVKMERYENTPLNRKIAPAPLLRRNNSKSPTTER